MAHAQTGLLTGADAANVAVPPPTTHVFVRHVADLAALFDPAFHVVVLRREPIAGVARYASSLAVHSGWRWVSSLEGNEPIATVTEALPVAPGRDELLADLLYWAQVVRDLTGSRSIGARLSRLTEPMCPAFHVDRVLVRLVTTYLGAGTEWREPATGRVRRARPFDVVLLKGEAWPGNAGRGAVHRSPPTRAPSPRLLLTLDPLG